MDIRNLVATSLEIEKIENDFIMSKFKIGQSVTYVDDFMPDTVEIITGVGNELIHFNHGSRSCIPEMIRPAEVLEQMLNRRIFTGEDLLKCNVQEYLKDHIPNGCMLVPKEPTEEMILKGTKANSECLNENAPFGERLYRYPAIQVYKAMIEALPATLMATEFNSNTDLPYTDPEINGEEN